MTREASLTALMSPCTTFCECRYDSPSATSASCSMELARLALEGRGVFDTDQSKQVCRRLVKTSLHKVSQRAVRDPRRYHANKARRSKCICIDPDEGQDEAMIELTPDKRLAQQILQNCAQQMNGGRK
jgi:hypothetical protein